MESPEPLDVDWRSILREGPFRQDQSFLSREDWRSMAMSPGRRSARDTSSGLIPSDYGDDHYVAANVKIAMHPGHYMNHEPAHLINTGSVEYWASLPGQTRDQAFVFEFEQGHVLAAVEWKDRGDGMGVQRLSLEAKVNGAWQKLSTWNAAKKPDLWFAVRGGGGGTYGIVTSVYYQLHEQVSQQLPQDYYIVFTLPAVLSSCTEEACNDLVRSLWLNFVRDFFHPKEEFPWKDDSKFCGTSSLNLDIFLGGGTIYCHGETAIFTFVGVWQSFVAGYQEALKAVGLSEEDVAKLQKDDGGIFAFSLSADWYPASLFSSPSFPWPAHMNKYPTELPDFPTPATYPENYVVDWTALVPVEWLYLDRGIPTLLALVKGGLGGPSTYVLGGQLAVSDDGLTSVPDFQRKAGFMLFLTGGESVESFLRGTFEEYIGGNSSTKAFPGGSEYLHISPIAYGPLIDDWTKACPDSLSDFEKAKKCLSLQESVWGTEQLAKLEEVKEKADPEHLFQCFDCVGFKGIRRSHRPWKPKPMFCLKPSYASTCYKWLDHDPAGDVNFMKKARSELLEALKHHYHLKHLVMPEMAKDAPYKVKVQATKLKVTLPVLSS